jgi:hypothetical protein
MRVVGLFSLLVATCGAQAPATLPRQFREVIVVKAEPAETVSSMACTQKSVARGSDGNWWLTIGRYLPKDETTGRAERSSLELWSSIDGVEWACAATVPMPRSGGASLVADPDQPRLHLLWNAADKNGLSEPFYQAFDLERREWVGTATKLATAVSGDDQYFASDLELAQNGALVAAIGSHSSPAGPPWNCGWSTAIRVLEPETVAWGPLQQLNVASYGVAANLHQNGNCIESSYRTCPHDAVIAVRTYDADKRAFVQDSDESVSGAMAESFGIANTSLVCTDALGGRYVLHVYADHGPGRGKVRVAYAQPGDNEWRCTDVFDDEPIIRGNEHYSHFVLARGSGNQMLAFYGKRSEQCEKLYQRTFDGGECIGPEKLLMKDRPGAFAALCGNRQGVLKPGVQLVASRQGEAASSGSVAVYGVLPSLLPTRRRAK